MAFLPHPEQEDMLKRTIIAILVGTSMSACATTNPDSGSGASGNKPHFSHIKTLPSPTVHKDDDKVITLEKIMSDPDWIGQQPENAYWSADSKSVYYQRKRPGNEVRDWYQHGLTGKAQKVALEQQHEIGSRSEVFSKDGRYSAYIFSGDLFVKNRKNGEITQITYTSARESSPQFLADGKVAFKVGDDYFAWDSQSRRVTQLAELKMADTPKGVTEPQSYIAKEQHKLIKFVAKEHRDAKDAEAQKNALKEQNKRVFDKTFYLGKGNNVVDSTLSPDGRYLIVALQKDVSWRGKDDIMPNYVTDDATIEAVPVRRRVADTKPQDMTFTLIDLQSQSQHELSFDTLPGFDEDVMAKVRAENYRRDGKTYESKKAPRSFTILGYNDMKFNDKGDKLALMVEAWDNKDRWIATVDLDSKELVSRHRYHDEAWVNYSYNDFGWLSNSDSLYYLSEESGFSHLYVDDLKGNVRQLTAGSWEVSDTTVSKDERFIYFTANKNHPGIHETYRVEVASGKLTQLTDLGGRNDYSLSPDGKKLLLVHSEVAMPPEVYVKEIGAKGKAKRLTHTVSDEYLSYNWNTPAIVPVASSEYVDPIFTKVYYPKDVMTGPKRKAAIFIHGAGYTQNSHLGWAYYFREFMFHSMLTQQGYVVIDMDYRASKGYGRDWRTEIYRQMGTPELQDLLDGVNWMVDNANVDKNRIGVYGGSYGGFMTLMALFKAPDVFQAGAALRLVSDWAHYNDGYTSNILNTPADDPIAYERSSPIYFAEGLKKPLLINAPMVDNNVFFQDTVRLVQRLIELEKPNFETAIFPVEPHAFRQPSSWLDEYRRIYRLFEQNL